LIEEDSFECQVFSRDTRLLKDPDTLNPIKYEVQSFLHGCDVSHGDSGSHILDRDSLEVVGPFFLGQLNYASPRFLIQQELNKLFILNSSGSL